MTGPIVVGVSLEGHGESAVRWAAGEAQSRGVGLCLVHASVVPRGGHPGLAGIDPGRALHALARRELDDMREMAHAVAPALPVEEHVVDGDPVDVLRARAMTASMVVIGDDGFGALGEVLLRGVARGLAGVVDVPLVVVPPRADRFTPEPARGPAPVVVGDDGTAGSRGAVHFAARRAAQRRAPLVVVRAGPDARLLPDGLPELGTRPPAVSVVIAEDRADRVLADQARDAELVVLGVADHGWLQHRHRTRPALARRSGCPVVVVSPDLRAPAGEPVAREPDRLAVAGTRDRSGKDVGP